MFTKAYFLSHILLIAFKIPLHGRTKEIDVSGAAKSLEIDFKMLYGFFMSSVRKILCGA